MALYDNINKRSPLQSVEFSPVEKGNFTFFYVDRERHTNEIKTWLTEKVGQEIIAETKVGGRPVLVTRGDKSKDDIKKAVEDHGDRLTKHTTPLKTDFWKLRSIASVVGQSLQIFSAAFKVTKDPHHHNKWTHNGIEGSVMTFAVLNMTANIMNYALGAQKSEDVHQLEFLKEQANHSFAPHLKEGEALVDIKEKRAPLRDPHKSAPSVLQKTKEFLQHHSVVIGEIGFRYVGSLGLLFPMAKKVTENGITKTKFFGGWQNIGKNLGEGEFKKAWEEGANKNPYLRKAGIGYLIGKGIALLTKVKDPYDTAPHTWVDTLREDVLFKVGSVVEACSGGFIAYNGFFNPENKIGFKNPKNPKGAITPMTDYAGGVGGTIFSIGYLIRLGAKFGEKQVNMKELEAHLSDSLMKVKDEDRAQLMADCTAAVKDHFPDKKVEFGELFTHVITDFEKHNKGAPLLTLAGNEKERQAKMDALTHPAKKKPLTIISDAVPEGTAAEQAIAVEKTTETAAAPSPSHAEKILRESGSEIGIGA